MLLTVSLWTALLGAPLSAIAPMAPAAPAPLAAQEPGDQLEVPAGVTEDDGDYIWLRFSEVEGQQLRYDQLIKLCQSSHFDRTQARAPRTAGRARARAG